MNEPKRIAMPRTKGLRIEANGCIVYIDHREDGTSVDVVPDGSRFAGKLYLGRALTANAGEIVEIPPTGLGIRVVVENDPAKVP